MWGSSGKGSLWEFWKWKCVSECWRLRKKRRKAWEGTRDWPLLHLRKWRLRWGLPGHALSKKRQTMYPVQNILLPGIQSPAWNFITIITKQHTSITIPLSSWLTSRKEGQRMLFLYVHTEASQVCMPLPPPLGPALVWAAIRDDRVTLLEHFHSAPDSVFEFLRYSETDTTEKPSLLTHLNNY